MKNIIKLVIATVFIIAIIFGAYYFKTLDNYDFTHYNHDEAYHMAEDLSSSELMGRAVGEIGNAKTVRYIENYLNDNLIEYEIQSIKQIIPIIDSKSVFKIGEDEFLLYKDYEFYIDNRYGDIDFDGDILYLGETLFEVDSKILDDRIVVIRTKYLSDDYIDYLLENGAKGVLYYTNVEGFTDKIDRNLMNKKWLNIENKIGSEIFAGRITLDFAKYLLETAKNDQYEEYYKKVSSSAVYSSGDQYVGLIHDVDLSINVDYKLLKVPSFVISFPGENSSIANNFITHFDGQGLGNDVVDFFPSAVNGGASTAGLLELAKSLKLQKSIPKEDINIVLLNGELASDKSTIDIFEILDKRYMGNKNIIIEHIGFKESKGLHIDWDYFNNQSAIIANQIFAYSSTMGVDFEFRDDPIVTYDEYKNFATLDNPLVLITGTHNNSMYGILNSSEDTFDIISKESMKNGSNILTGYINKELYNHIPLDFIDEWVFSLLIAVLFMGLLITYINNLYHYRKNRLIRNIYYSRTYTLIASIYKYFILFGGALVLIALILNIPQNFDMIKFANINISNFSLYNLLRGTYFSLLNLFTILMNPSSQIFQKIIIYITKSMKLISIGLVLSLFFGILKGVSDSYSAKSYYSIKTLTSIIAYSIPDVMVAIVSLLGIIHLSKIGWVNELIGPTLLRTVIMPIVALIVIPSIYISRLIYVTIQEEKQKEYVKFLYYKGIPRKKVYFRQFVFVSIIKVLQSMKTILMVLFSNLILVEYIFSYPGIMFNILTYNNNPYIVIMFALAIGIMFVMLTGLSRFILWLILPKRRGLS
ncbi:MAG: ABC transporter permease subunit [Bacillota bacterium]|nr:ABC transporter permease subunit [Bacillota bacterium]